MPLLLFEVISWAQNLNKLILEFQKTPNLPTQQKGIMSAWFHPGENWVRKQTLNKNR